MVIELANEGKTTREIAKEVHISLKDIGKIIRKITGDEDLAEKSKEEEKEKQKRIKSLSPYAKAFQMFKDNKGLADVVIELDSEAVVVLNFHADYLRLVRINGLVDIYQELKNEFPLFFYLYMRIKKEGLNKQDISDLLQNQQRLVEMEKRVNLYNNHIQDCNHVNSN